MKKNLTRLSAAMALGAITATINGRAQDELKEDGVIQAIKSNVNRETNGFDIESISFDHKESTGYNGSIVLGDEDASLKFDKQSGGVDVESFDSIDTNNPEEVRLAAIQIVNNNLASTDDGIITLCQTRNVPSANNGIKLSVAVPYINHGGINKAGSLIGAERIPLIANLNSNDVFNQGLKPFLPVYRTAGDYATNDVLATEAGLQRTTAYNGESVVTSPILVGKKVSLRKICSTNSYLTTFGSGINAEETLAADAGVKTVYIELEGATDTNILAFPVKGLKGSRFTPTTSGSGKDLTLNLEAVQSFKLSELVSKNIMAHSTTAATPFLADGAGEELEITVSFSVNANTNTDDMILTTTAASLELVSIKDSGTLIESGAKFDSIKAIVDGGSVHSVYPELTLSNTNLADKSIIIDMDPKEYVVPLTTRVPVTYRKSLIKLSDSDIIHYLSAAKITNNSALATDVFNNINDFIEANADRVDADGFITSDVAGIGAQFAKPMIVKKSIVATNRNTIESSNTGKDVASYLLDTIVATANRVLSDSNLSKARDAMLPGEKITLVIAADSMNASIMRRALSSDISSRFEIVINESSKLSNRAIATFHVGDDVNELTPVILGKSTDYIYKGTETTGNGGQRDVTSIVPIRGFYINNPIFMDFNISGVVDSFDRQ